MTSESSASIAPPDHQLPPSTTAPPRKRRHRWMWAVILIAFGLLFYWVITQHQKSQQAATGRGRRGAGQGIVPVVPATAKVGSLGVYLASIGTVTPYYMDSITAQATGVITEVHYREGQTVHKGDPLIDIDPRQYAAQLAQAQGILERDQNLLAEARMDLARYQTAWSKNAIPRQTYEDQEKLVLQDEGTVKNDEGTVQYDQVQLGYCHIVSPINGRVGLRLVDPGNLVTANSATTLVVVTQVQPITVIFTVPEDNLQQVMTQMRKGVTMPVDAWDRSNASKLATGRLLTVDNLIDTTTGTVKLRAEFTNSNGILFANQFVNARLLVNTLQNQILVPSSAIQHNGDQAYVFVIEKGPGTVPNESSETGGSNQQARGNRKGGATRGGTNQGGGATQNPGSAGAGQNEGKEQYHVVMRTVKPGASDNGVTAVQGIQAGEIVADSSFEKLLDGSSVTISKVGLPVMQTTIAGESNAP